MDMHMLQDFADYCRRNEVVCQVVCDNGIVVTGSEPQVDADAGELVIDQFLLGVDRFPIEQVVQVSIVNRARR